MSLLDDVSIVVTPNGYKAGELYAVVPVPTEGAEEVDCGTFDCPNPEAEWTLTSSANIANGKLNVSAGAFDFFAIQTALINGNFYKISIEVVVTNGSVLLYTGNQFATISSSGFYNYYFTSNSTQLRFRSSGSGFIGSIDNVSVKEWVGADMDVTRATAATRVDEDGLVNYAEVLGSDLASDGDFLLTGTQAENITGTYWNTGASWSIASGVASCDGTQTSGTYLGQTGLTFTNAKTYKVTYTVTVSAGNISARLQGSGATVTGTSRTSSGTYTDYLVSTGNTSFRMRGNTDFVGTVTNISVKEVTRDNVPRIDYTGGGCPHILSEPMRTNLINYSEDLSEWTLVNGTLTPNATVSPDGTQNAGKVAFNNTGVDLKKTITVVAGQTYTISFYIKLESGTGLDGRFYDNNNSANIEVYDYTSQIQGTEWSKITRSVTAPSGCTQMQIWLLASSSSLVTASFWGAQFEEGSYATSYIPNFGTSAGVTRNQDIFTRDGIGSLINSTEGVLFVEMAALSDDSVSRKISLNSGTFANQITVSYGSGGSNIIQCIIYDGTNVVVNMSYSSTNITDFNKIAIKYISGNTSLWVNGVEVDTDNAAFSGLSLSALSFDNGSSTNFFYGKVKQLQVYNTALTDAQLTSLTS